MSRYFLTSSLGWGHGQLLDHEPCVSHPLPIKARPLDVLPPEILAEIFVLSSSARSARPDSRTAPLLFLAVSRHWRDVAQSTPALWSSLVIECSTWAGEPNLPCIEAWIARSGMRPLDLALTLDVSFYELRGSLRLQTNFVDVFRIFSTHQRRWRKMYLSLIYSFSTSEATIALHHISQSGPWDSPLLEELHIAASATPEMLQVHTCHDVLRTLPRLQKFTYLLVDSEAPTVNHTQAWSHLQKIHLKCVLSVNQCVQILASLPALEICYLQNISGPARMGAALPVAIELRQLHTLRAEGPVNLTSLLQALTLPSLTSLTIERIITIPSNEIGNLFNFVARSNPPLKKLVLDSYQVEEEELIRSLHLLPALQVLEINDEGMQTRMSDNLMTALSDRDPTRDTFLCPQLESIKFIGRVNTTDGRFKSMIKARWKGLAEANGVACLKAVHVEFTGNNGGRDQHINDMRFIQEAREGGLKARAFFRG